MRWIAVSMVVLTSAACAAAESKTRYTNCSEAPGPITKGEPGYRKALDRDGDGVACN